MTGYKEGIQNYIGRFAARLMGLGGVLDAEKEIPAETANQIVVDLKMWLTKPVLVKDSITVAELAEYFDQNIR